MKFANISKYLESLKFLIRPETLGGAIIAVTIIAVTINTSNVILQNYRLERQVLEAEQKVSIATMELDNQKIKNQYYRTDAFLEIAARKQLSKGLPGEKMVIVPKSVALAYAGSSVESFAKPEYTPEKRNNLQRWLDFLGGNLSESDN